MPAKCHYMSDRIRPHRTLVRFKRRPPNVKNLLQDLYQMEPQSDEEMERTLNLPIIQLEGDED